MLVIGLSSLTSEAMLKEIIRRKLKEEAVNRNLVVSDTQLFDLSDEVVEYFGKKFNELFKEIQDKVLFANEDDEEEG